MAGARLALQVTGAIADGRIAVEELVELAAKQPELRTWLQERVAKQAEPRRLALQRRASYPRPVVEAALARAKRELTRHGVLAVAWGTMETRGTNHGHPGVILFVREKIPAAQLQRGRRLPTKLVVRVSGKTHTVSTDVQRVPRGHKHANPRPGHLALAIGPIETGTLSALVTTGSGLSALVSGHVGDVGQAFQARLGNGNTIALGTVARSREDATVDAARIDGVDPTDINLLSTPPAAIRELDSNDLNVVLTFRLAQHGGDTEASVDGIDMPATFDKDDGTQVAMTGLIKMSATVTTFGDSGAPVIDYHNQLVGFVIGSAGGHTYVIPAKKVIDAMA